VGFQGDTSRNAVEPACEPIGVSQRSRLSDEEQERGLESVIGVRDVARNSTTHTEHRRCVSSDENGERFRIARREAFDEFHIRCPTGVG